MRRFVLAFSSLILICLLAVASTATSAPQGLQIVALTSDNMPLASLAQAAADARLAAAQAPLGQIEVPNFYPGPDLRTQVANVNLGQDPLLAPFVPSGPAAMLTQFEGASNQDNLAVVGGLVTPPDTNGEVSSDATDRFVQMVNLVTKITNKNGAVVAGGAPFPNSAFWSGMGNFCESTNRGDPIILYDEKADRWFVSHFAFTSTAIGPWLQCIAVSTSSDPLGGYNRYAWAFDAIGFNDYPHFGITTNAIGMMANLFAPGFAGTWISSIDKACVYSGGANCANIGANLGTGEFGFLPLDLDDPTASAGFVPSQFGTAMSLPGFFDIWTIVPDFVNPPPGATTVTRTSRIPISAIDSDLCPIFRERCIPHPGSGDNLETLSGRLMHRNQVRSFGTHLAMVAAHTVDVDAAAPGGTGRSGIRWYEFRSTDGGTNWSLHQEGTHGPADTLHRWMPSIAMNAKGDIGLGYMVSNATTPPEIRVTGQSAGSGGNRLQIGAPAVFDVAETVCRAGINGSDWAGRSGDYSATSVDPTSGSFWHTNEYGRLSSLRGWGTGVCEFSLPAPGVYVLDGYGGVNSAGNAPVMSPATPYFGFDVARDLELAATGYYVLDGWGGLHAGGGAAPMVGPPYFGFDASADLELAPTGNYALDIYGGVHASAGAPTLTPATPYFGFDAARDFELGPTGYYVFDAWGGLHFGGGAPVLNPRPPYFGFDASEDIEVTPTGLYALDSFGGVHAVGGAPALTSAPPYFGFDAARDMELAGTGMYVLDAWGGLHAANGASVVSPGPPYYGFDIAKDLEIR